MHDDRKFPVEQAGRKLRLLVMNGQKLTQSERDGKWETDKVEKAGALKPGIYNLHAALPSELIKTYDGAVLHIGVDHVYQQVGKAIVRHDRVNFDKLPDIDGSFLIRYDGGRAVLSRTVPEQGRARKR